VHIAFPLHVPGAEFRYDFAFGLCRTELDQLPGSNRNHLTVAYGADVSNRDFNVTIACPDAPLLEVGKLRADPIVTGWDRRLEPSSTLFGYVMNSYWETNYRAEQPGLVSLRYRLFPHGGRDAAANRRFAVAVRRPLLVTVVATDGRSAAPSSCPHGPGIEIVAMRPVVRGVLMTLHNAAEDPVSVVWTAAPTRVRRCDLDGGHSEPLAGDLVVPAHGLRSIVIEIP
jgi:alpha-mannosidase